MTRYFRLTDTYLDRLIVTGPSTSTRYEFVYPTYTGVADVEGSYFANLRDYDGSLYLQEQGIVVVTPDVIRDAIEALVANQTLELEAGTYIITDQIDIPAADVTIECAGIGRTIIQFDAADGLDLFNINGRLGFKLKNCSLQGVSGNGLAVHGRNGAHDAILENVEVTGFEANRIGNVAQVYFTDSDRVKLIDVEASNSPGSRGIRLFNCDDAQIIRPVTNLNYYEGMWNNECDRLEVRDPKAKNNGVGNESAEVNIAITLSDHMVWIGGDAAGHTGAYGEHNVEISACDYPTIVGLRTHGAKQAGLFSFQCKHVQYIGIESYSNGDDGFLFADSEGITTQTGKMTNCISKANGAKGVTCSDLGFGGGFGVQDLRIENCDLTGNTDVAILADPGSANIEVDGCDLTGNGGGNGGAYFEVGSGVGALKFNNCKGLVTFNKGTAVIPSGATSVAVTHGLAFTPLLSDITLTPGELPTSAPGLLYVTAIGATTFTINSTIDPGASNLDVGWSARARGLS